MARIARQELQLCKARIARQELQGKNCKARIARQELQGKNCNAGIAMARITNLQGNNCKPRIARQELRIAKKLRIAEGKNCKRQELQKARIAKELQKARIAITNYKSRIANQPVCQCHRKSDDIVVLPTTPKKQYILGGQILFPFLGQIFLVFLSAVHCCRSSCRIIVGRGDS
jgi:hypothetical protein